MEAAQNALLDITVLVDAIVNGQEPDNASKTLLDLAVAGHIEGYVCATAIESLGEILTRDCGPAEARASLQRICATLVIAPVDAAVIDGAMSLGMRYLDDALTLESARRLGLDNLVTLNGPDFDHPSMNVQDPEEFLRALQRGQ
jgi:predicted nucleic acid-binding protein